MKLPNQVKKKTKQQTITTNKLMLAAVVKLPQTVGLRDLKKSPRTILQLFKCWDLIVHLSSFPGIYYKR